MHLATVWLSPRPTFPGVLNFWYSDINAFSSSYDLMHRNLPATCSSSEALKSLATDVVNTSTLSVSDHELEEFSSAATYMCSCYYLYLTFLDSYNISPYEKWLFYVLQAMLKLSDYHMIGYLTTITVSAAFAWKPAELDLILISST